jgi:hypothetical protein
VAGQTQADSLVLSGRDLPQHLNVRPSALTAPERVAVYAPDQQKRARGSPVRARIGHGRLEGSELPCQPHSGWRHQTNTFTDTADEPVRAGVAVPGPCGCASDDPPQPVLDGSA